MAEKNKKLPEYCGECHKAFSYNDWANPVASLIEHKSTDCPGPRKHETA